MSNLQKVKEFHEIYNLPVLKKIQIPKDRVNMRLDILTEELNELKEAVENNDIVEVFDALIDIEYLIHGTALEFGLQDYMQDGFNEVHRSNMSKLDLDGNPIYREDGKVLKGPNYSPPNLSSILET